MEHHFLSSAQEKGEDNQFASPNSLSPTPSPQPFNSIMQFEEDANSEQDLGIANICTLSKKASKRGRKSQDELKNVNRGHWSSDQNKKYHWFLEIHYRHFVNRYMRRMDKIFKTMEIFIGTRQAEQCRSHHQKMQKKYMNFISIL